VLFRSIRFEIIQLTLDGWSWNRNWELQEGKADGLMNTKTQVFLTGSGGSYHNCFKATLPEGVQDSQYRIGDSVD
jgi:hypothetical protein